MQDFERIFTVVNTQYGVIMGSNNVLFIKAGLHGSTYGYENKYLQIARNINKKYGFTVICASNPRDDVLNPLEQDMAVIADVCKDFTEYSVYYQGISNGAVLGACYGYTFPHIKKMLLINPPLFINWNKIKEGLQQWKGENVNVIVGENDPSAKYAPMIDFAKNDKVKYSVIKNADHNFCNMLTEFINLTEEYLLRG